MRHIAKGAPPAFLPETAKASTTDLETPGGARTAFDQLDKAAVRAALAAEQRQLCAFCMRRIDPAGRDAQGQPTMKIAHRTPISVAPDVALTWSNLLGSCDGGQRMEKLYRTCDAAQGDAALTVDPTRTESVARLRYERRGATEGLFITADDPELRGDVEKTLKLNAAGLPAARLSAWKGFQKRALEKFPGEYGKPGWQKYVGELRRSSGAALLEYFGVLETMSR
jgi:uncharacterized protein (TIGR02646 family)